MGMCHQLKLLAAYNAGINRQLCAVAAQLPAEALQADRQAFFGSILGTFNHVLVGDLIWLRRFAQHPTTLPQFITALFYPSGAPSGANYYFAVTGRVRFW